MKIPNNQEHLEMLAADIDKNREEFLKTCTPESKKRIEAVQKCKELLEEEGVPFFVAIPLEGEKLQIWDDTNLYGRTLTYSESGKPDKESEVKLGSIFTYLLMNILNRRVSSTRRRFNDAKLPIKYLIEMDQIFLSGLVASMYED